MTVRERVAGGVAAAERAVKQIGNVSNSVVDLAAKVKNLNIATEQITTIVKTIEKIASQTNLLALNATIEASRAGESGKGFAVVAGEVKTLANQTAKATEDIRQRIFTVQAGMTDILNAMAKSGESVEEGTKAVCEAVEVISGISHEVDGVTNKMTQIASIVQEQSAATSEVAASIAGTAGMSEHALSTIEGLATAVDQVGKAVQPQLLALGKDPDNHRLVQLARSDHASFKKRVIDTLVGRGNARDNELPDHHACRFGKWYDSLTDVTVKNSAAYSLINEPHLKVHAYGKEALSYFHQGHFNSAIAAAGKMEEASHEVFSALDDIALIIRNNTPQI
ncbi:methyl-accepting chemotaxis protein [uncultured Gammaproteobacteria bacterium]